MFNFYISHQIMDTPGHFEHLYINLPDKSSSYNAI